MSEDIARRVHSDIEARVVRGAAEYGERLRAHNGRDALLDAYEEALDLVLYLRQALDEQEASPPQTEDEGMSEDISRWGSWPW